MVNLSKLIISTREVPPQQEIAGGKLSVQEAMAHRLELVKERKFTKQDWKVRDIEFVSIDSLNLNNSIVEGYVHSSFLDFDRNK